MTETGHFAVVFDVLDHDVETLVRAVARSRRVLLVSDARSPRVEALQEDVGADLLVASHRLIDSGSGLRHSDFDLAAQIGAVHASRPLGAIVYASDAIIDFGWYEKALTAIPRGRLLKGMFESTDEVLSDTHEFVASGPTIVALWGDAATSDFIVTRNPSLGLPPWKGVESLSCAKSAWDAKHATVLDGRGLSRGNLLIEAVTAADEAAGLVVVLASDKVQGAAVHAMLPEPVAGRVLVGSPSDPWIAEILGSGGLAPIEALAAFQNFVPSRRPIPDATVAVVEEMEELAAILDAMTAAGGEETLVAVARDAQLAEAILGSRALSADLGFMAAHRVPMGDLDPERIRSDVVAIGARARGVARMAADASPDFRTLIFRLTEPSMITSAIVGLVPNMDGPHPEGLRAVRSPLDLGLRLTPAVLPLPNAAAEPHPPVPEPLDPKAWVGRLGWGTRSRLALPWRWNLLPRAMKDRW